MRLPAILIAACVVAAGAAVLVPAGGDGGVPVRPAQFDVPVVGDGGGGGDADANAFPLPTTDATSAVDDVGVTLTEVSDHPQPIVGHQATISGRVERHLSDRALLLGDSDTVLVVAEQGFDALIPATRSIDADEVMAVTGLVQAPDQIPFERFGIPPGALEGYSGGIVMARSVELDPEQTPRGGDTEEVDESAYADQLVTLREIVQDASEYLGQRVTVSGEIEKVVGSGAFVIGDSQLLVVDAGRATPFPEATAVVTGTIRRVDRQVSQQSSFAVLDEAVLGIFQNQPAIVAENVQIIS